MKAEKRWKGAPEVWERPVLQRSVAAQILHAGISHVQKQLRLSTVFMEVSGPRGPRWLQTLAHIMAFHPAENPVLFSAVPGWGVLLSCGFCITCDYTWSSVCQCPEGERAEPQQLAVPLRGGCECPSVKSSVWLSHLRVLWSALWGWLSAGVQHVC